MVSRSNSERREGALHGGATALCALLLAMTACTPILPDDPDSGSDGGPGEMDGGLDAATQGDAGTADAGSADAGLVQPDDGGVQPDDGGPPDAGPRCGDGIVDSEEAGEVCDDSNTVGGDGCSADCMSDETCGNGIRDLATDEACDDGNTAAGDLCPPECDLRPVSITAGSAHTCTLLSDGRVYCWGRNSSGQLGNGADLDDGVDDSSLTPVEVTGLTGIVQIASGDEHSCAVRNDGAVFCWGSNSYGQLGASRTMVTASSTPLSVSGHTAVEVVVGWAHSCTRSASGSVMCWGDNGFGALGNGASLPAPHSPTPVSVVGLVGTARELSAATFTNCSLDGVRVSCWGHDGSGTLGNGAPLEHSSTAVRVSGISDDWALGLSGGEGHFCVNGVTGTACWGLNSSGQLGNGTVDSSPSVVYVTPLLVAHKLVAGGRHTCAIRGSARDVVCWGENEAGQIGNGAAPADVLAPTSVVGLTGVLTLGSGPRAAHTCAIRNDGVLLCWGRNSAGQLGNGLTENSSTPVVAAAGW